jgi:hypothetical protein
LRVVCIVVLTGRIDFPNLGPEPQAREAPPHSGGAVNEVSGNFCFRCCCTYVSFEPVFPTFGIHLSYFILHPSLSTVSRNQESFVTGLQSYLIQPVAKIHFIALEPPSPLKKGDVTAQKELFRPRVKGITAEASKIFHLPFILFHTGLHKSFSARVVFIPQAPRGGCDYAAISMSRLRSFLRPADV